MNAGKKLQKLRKKETKPCIGCGIIFTKYVGWKYCKKCGNAKRQERRRQKMQEKMTF